MNDTLDKAAFITNLHALKRVGLRRKSRGRYSSWHPTIPPFVTRTAALIDGGLSITRT